MKTAKMGHFYKVANKKLRFGEKDEYYALNFEDESGKLEQWALFTASEIKLFFTRQSTQGSTWLDKILKEGRMMPLMKGKAPAYITKVVLNGEKKPVIVHVADRILKLAVERAKKNPEDIPYKSKLQDLLD